MSGREICEFTHNAVDIVVCLRVKDYPPKQTRKLRGLGNVECVEIAKLFGMVYQLRDELNCVIIFDS